MDNCIVCYMITNVVLRDDVIVYFYFGYFASLCVKEGAALGEAGTSQLSGEEARKEKKRSLGNQDGSKVLPFEFVALEACLEAASSSLESEVYICSYG